jgi:hypothetical protein
MPWVQAAKVERRAPEELVVRAVAADRWAMAGAAALEASLVPVAEAVSVAETPNRAL